MFRVGQKVVCVNSEKRPGFGKFSGDVPQKGTIYTVSAYVENGTYGDPSVWLVEIKNHNGYGRGDIGYWAERFRPLVSTKTDISFAHEIVRKVFEGVRA